MRATIRGHKAEFCGASCRDGFRADRRAGLIYGPSAIRMEDGSVRLALTREAFSLLTGFCAYCSANVSAD
jgi:hypothetical protein